MPNVTHPEKAFLQLMGRRLLRYQQEAAARNETYNDLSGYSPLQCGARAKFRFELVSGTPIPVVYLRGGLMSPGELKEIASEIFEGPAKLRAAVGDDLEYVRETDAGTSVAG